MRDFGKKPDTGESSSVGDMARGGKDCVVTACHVRTESVGVESATYGEHLCSLNPYLPWPQRLRGSTAPETHSTRLSKALLSSLG